MKKPTQRLNLPCTSAGMSAPAHTTRHAGISSSMPCRSTGSGLIYGMGHAVYTLSDPRTVILRQSARTLAAQRGMLDELELMEAVERVTPRVFAEITGHEKVMCANVDMYPGLIYQMLDIPPDLFTPLFAVARITGWCAHRMEEVLTGGRLYRPAYKSLTRHREYIPMAARTYRKNPLPAEKRD